MKMQLIDDLKPKQLAKLFETVIQLFYTDTETCVWCFKKELVIEALTAHDENLECQSVVRRLKMWDVYESTVN